MLKSPLMRASLSALALGFTAFTPLAAQDATRTKTYEGPNVSGSKTTTVNPETGTATRDRSVTNLNTGNTATSNAVRQRTETGATVDVVQTGPQGNARSLEGTRVRTEGGSTFTGTATGRGGETYGLFGNRSRDGQGNAQASQSVTDSAGNVLAGRERATTRGNGQVNHSLSRTRAEGFNPQRARNKNRPRG